MLCDICRKNSATVHLTEIINEKVVEMHICQECAKDKASQIKENLSISNLLGPLLDSATTPRERNIVCSVCGLGFADFKKKGRFGCAHCYRAFKEQLPALLKSIQGSVRYLGKTPITAQKEYALNDKIKSLKEQLARAVHLENYEEAARLRDELKSMEEKNKYV